jgi:hypothetical protein
MPPTITLATAFERDKPSDIGMLDILDRSFSGKPLMELNTSQIDSTSTNHSDMMYAESKFGNQSLIFRWPDMALYHVSANLTRRTVHQHRAIGPQSLASIKVSGEQHLEYTTDLLLAISVPEKNYIIIHRRVAIRCSSEFVDQRK